MGIYYGRSGPYVSIYKGGFFRKTTGTNKLKSMHDALENKTVSAVVENPDGTLFVSSAKGVFKSKDDGKTWKHTFAEGWVQDLVAANGVLVGNSLHGLIRSTDEGENWEQVLHDEGGIYSISVIDGHFAVVRVAGSTRPDSEANPLENSLLRTSSDGGKTWDRMNSGLLDADFQPAKYIYDLQQAGKYLFCCHDGGISRSSDWGESWELVRSAASLKQPYRFALVVSGEKVFVAVVWGGC